MAKMLKRKPAMHKKEEYGGGESAGGGVRARAPDRMATPQEMRSIVNRANPNTSRNYVELRGSQLDETGGQKKMYKGMAATEGKSYIDFMNAMEKFEQGKAITEPAGASDTWNKMLQRTRARMGKD